MKKLLLGIFILSSYWSVAQQTEIYNQFFMNPYLYNAAYAGVEGHTVLYALYHNKWTNLEGAPEISHFSFHTPLKGGIGIGAYAFNDRYGPINKNQGKVSASYLITIDREHHLRMGMSVGMGTQALNFSVLDDPTDPAFMDIVSNSSYMIADFGATYHFDHFNVGFSIPNLIGYDIFQGESLSPIRVKPLDNLMLKANYRGHISHDIAIEPHLIYRYSNLVPDQIEATVIFHIYHLVWAGATYRQNNTYAATLGAKIKEKFALGYAFELGNANISGLTGPSHEIHIGMHLGTKKEHAAHVSSFIKSHRLTPEQREALAAKEREEKLKALQASRQAPRESSDELSIAGTRQQSDDALGIAGTSESESQEDVVEDLSLETKWEIDNSIGTSTRTNPFGEREKALVIKHLDAQGDTAYAVAWEPVEEDWELVDEAPINRSSSDGSTEIGVKYYRTKPNGEKELIIKWEPVVTRSQMLELLASSSTEEVLAQSTPSALTQETDNVVTNEPETTVTEVPESNVEEVAPADPPAEQLAQNDEDAADAPTEEEPLPVDPETTTNEEVIEPAQEVISTPPAIITEDPIAENKDERDQEREKGDEALTEDFRTHQELAESDEPLAVNRGNHLLELPAGYYLIGGAFEEYEHAENYSDELFPKGYHDVIVGYSSARGYYYTVLSRHANLNEANAEKAKIRRRAGMSDVWVLNVEN